MHSRGGSAGGSAWRRFPVELPAKHSAEPLELLVELPAEPAAELATEPPAKPSTEPSALILLCLLYRLVNYNPLNIRCLIVLAIMPV